jgi:hypothetical protein
MNSPKAISKLPDILFNNTELGLMANAVRPAIAPKVEKINAKPRTKLKE